MILIFWVGTRPYEYVWYLKKQKHAYSLYITELTCFATELYLYGFH